MGTLWVLGCVALYGVMRQSPERFGRVMAKIPGPIPFLVFPFETLWMQARAGTLWVGNPAPDFALAAWALHMTLRNGDRAALSKPVTLRGGATVALEVVVVRKDGFDGEIELAMENLPEGVSACGLKIPAGDVTASI